MAALVTRQRLALSRVSSRNLPEARPGEGGEGSGPAFSPGSLLPHPSLSLELFFPAAAEVLTWLQDFWSLILALHKFPIRFKGNREQRPLHHLLLKAQGPPGSHSHFS